MSAGELSRVFVGLTGSGGSADVLWWPSFSGESRSVRESQSAAHSIMFGRATIRPLFHLGATLRPPLSGPLIRHFTNGMRAPYGPFKTMLICVSERFLEIPVGTEELTGNGW